MEAYRLYWVTAGKVKPGKSTEATRWWAEKAAPDIRSDPWTKSLNAYAVQFGLGGEYTIEIWQEIENYAAFDAMDQSFIGDQGEALKKLELWEEGQQFFDWGPSRLMGDWPQSSFDRD